MANINIIYNTTTGRILSASLTAIAPVPSGYDVTVKDIPGITSLFEKRINPTSLDLEDKDFLQLDSSAEIPVSTVSSVVFTKRDGETSELKDDPADNESVTIGTRKSDLSFKDSERIAFLDRYATQLVQGAGEAKLASGAAASSETLIVHHEDLTPIVETISYV